MSHANPPAIPPSDPHAPHALDAIDPHHEAHHHVIIRPSTLVAILLTLMALTALTIATSQAEKWFGTTFGVEIPHLVNAVVALSIAVVKAILVFMFFMQLKYDNPLNSLVVGFCFFAVALFLFFSMTDVAQRGAIYSYKYGETQSGGQGITRTKETVTGGETKSETIIDTGGKAITAYWKERRISEVGVEQYLKEYAEAHSHGSHATHDDHAELSTAARSRAPKAVGPALFEDRAGAPAAAPHGGH
ncbi:MAG: cytochrome C oxidase subunit IV family protein [Phycisphaerales bacterium]